MKHARENDERWWLGRDRGALRCTALMDYRGQGLGPNRAEVYPCIPLFVQLANDRSARMSTTELAGVSRRRRMEHTR